MSAADNGESCGFCTAGLIYIGTDRETECLYCDGTGEVQ